MAASPFNDALEALEEIRAYCEKREKDYEGWGKIAEAFDLRTVREKAEQAISSLTPCLSFTKKLDNDLII
tara:strand:- start:74 stop:283 length:210 start_codon:yes stop_codon:yes gene_type:complete